MAAVYSIDDLRIECESWMGTPYIHRHGKKGVGTDCLGYMIGVCSKFSNYGDVTIPNYTPMWSDMTRVDALLGACRKHLISHSGDMHGAVVVFKMRHNSVTKHCGFVFKVDGQLFLYHSLNGHGVVKSGLTDDWKNKISGVFRVPGVKYDS